MAVPVYFNDPTSLLQKCAQSMEYNYLLDLAAKEQDPIRRHALVAVHVVTTLTICEKTATKPFNPMLGETFEFVTDDFEYLAEQVTHHPPVTACYCKGLKSNYLYQTNQKTNIKFSGKALNMRQQFRAYIDLPDFQERYEVEFPIMELHNFIIGTPYIDIAETMKINKRDSQQKAIINFSSRGWFAKDKDIAKIEGKICNEIDQGKKKKFTDTSMLITGNWNADIYLQRVLPSQGEIETVWSKVPYPENHEMMYGMSHFSLQMNYFPSRLHNKVAPTDTRRRPDQRALENGDMKAAADHKEFLEQKQRAVRKYKEENKIEHQAAYFEPWENPADGQVYYMYNNKYFEQNRPNQEWSQSPDLFTENCPAEI